MQNHLNLQEFPRAHMRVCVAFPLNTAAGRVQSAISPRPPAFLGTRGFLTLVVLADNVNRPYFDL